MNIFRKIHNKLLIASKRQFVLRTTLYNFVFALTLGTLINILGGEDTAYNPIMDYNPIAMFLVGVLISPFLETWFFQWVLLILPLKSLGATPKNILIAVLLSSLLFGFAHSYNHYYVIAMIITGGYFGYIAILSVFLREEKINIFYSVFIAHALSNFIGILPYMLKVTF